METSMLSGTISGVLSFGRGFTFPSLDNMEAHFMGDQNQDYRDGFCHVLVTALIFIDSEYSSLTELTAGQCAEIRDKHIETVLDEVKRGNYGESIPSVKMEEFNNYFRPIVMAYVKFRYQPGPELDRKTVDVQGGHFDRLSFCVGYGKKRENMIGPDIVLFRKNAEELDDDEVMPLVLASPEVARDIESVTVEPTEHVSLEPQVPLSAMYLEPVYRPISNVAIPVQQSAQPITTTVPLFNPGQPLTNYPGHILYLQQPAYGQVQENFSASQQIYYSSNTPVQQPQTIYTTQSYPTNGVGYIQGYPSNFVQQPPPQYPQQQSPQQTYSQIGSGYQPNPQQQQQGWDQAPTYPDTNPFVKPQQQTPTYPQAGYPSTGYPQGYPPTGQGPSQSYPFVPQQNPQQNNYTGPNRNPYL